MTFLYDLQESDSKLNLISGFVSREDDSLTPMFALDRIFVAHC
jgi:hypothetical protein